MNKKILNVRGRPMLPKSKRRNNIIRFLVTEADKIAMKKRATFFQLSVSNYFRMLFLKDIKNHEQ